MANRKTTNAPAVDAAPDVTDTPEVTAAPAENKVARHCNSGACVFCGGGTHTHFEEGFVVVACSGCRGAIRYSAMVISKPMVEKVREKIASRYELGLVGKENYARMTGTAVIPGRAQKVKDPTDPESEADIAKAIAPNAKVKEAAGVK